MGLIRGKIWTPKIFPKVHEVGGPSPWLKCKCGKWKSRETGEHVELVTKTLRELMQEHDMCPDEKQPRSDEGNG